VIYKLIRQFKEGRYFMDVVKLKLPILGTILTKTAIARFTRTLGTLVAAGVPILEAITITKDTSGNEVYSRALAKVHDSIREGEQTRASSKQRSTWDTFFRALDRVAGIRHA
jgi:type IV pilus assembly protein PilC